jgi:hypothetical protein
MMPVTPGEDIMEKQPDSRVCFVCGIENPIGLKLRFYTDDEGRCIALSANRATFRALWALGLAC